MSVLMLVTASCAQGGADGASAWTSPTGLPADAPSTPSWNDDGATGAVDGSPASSFSPVIAVSPSDPVVLEAAAAESSASSDPPSVDDATSNGTGNNTASTSTDDTSSDAADNTAPLASDDSGSTPQSSDSGVDPTDDAPYPDPTVFPADLGDLLITEVMFSPSGPSPASEWFEVYNSADSPTLLSGLTIVDGAMHTHTIASSPEVVVPASAYVLLVRDRATALANGISPDAIAYEYGTGLGFDEGIQLDDGPTGAVSLWNGDVELAAVPYGSWCLVALGQSIELAVLQLVGSDAYQGWCFGQYPWASGSDYGTPGAQNDCP